MTFFFGRNLTTVLNIIKKHHWLRKMVPVVPRTFICTSWYRGNIFCIILATRFNIIKTHHWLKINNELLWWPFWISNDVISHRLSVIFQHITLFDIKPHSCNDAYQIRALYALSIDKYYFVISQSKRKMKVKNCFLYTWLTILYCTCC